MYYIARIYCSSKDKGYLTDFEKNETQVITIHNNDEQHIPFILYDVCSNITEINLNEIVTALMMSANNESANVWGIEDITKSVTYTLKSLSGTTVLSGQSAINEYNAFTIHIEDVDTGFYNLTITVTVNNDTFTRTLPLIST